MDGKGDESLNSSELHEMYVFTILQTVIIILYLQLIESDYIVNSQSHWVIYIMYLLMDESSQYDMTTDWGDVMDEPP